MSESLYMTKSVYYVSGFEVLINDNSNDERDVIILRFFAVESTAV